MEIKIETDQEVYLKRRERVSRIPSVESSLRTGNGDSSGQTGKVGHLVEGKRQPEFRPANPASFQLAFLTSSSTRARSVYFSTLAIYLTMSRGSLVSFPPLWDRFHVSDFRNSLCVPEQSTSWCAPSIAVPSWCSALRSHSCVSPALLPTQRNYSPFLLVFCSLSSLVHSTALSRY